MTPGPLTDEQVIDKIGRQLKKLKKLRRCNPADHVDLEVRRMELEAQRDWLKQRQRERKSKLKLLRFAA